MHNKWTSTTRSVCRVVQGYRCIPDVQLLALEDLCAARLAKPLLGAASDVAAGITNADKTCHIQVTPASVSSCSVSLQADTIVNRDITCLLCYITAAP
jgi:hypothetical protein